MGRTGRALRDRNRTCSTLCRRCRLAGRLTGCVSRRARLRVRHLRLSLVPGVPGIGVRIVRSKGTAGVETVHIELDEPPLLRLRAVVDRDRAPARLDIEPWNSLDEAVSYAATVTSMM